MPARDRSAFKPFAGIERNRLKVVRGADDLQIIGGDSAHDADDLPQYARHVADGPPINR